MDLKGNKITVRELMADPKAREVLTRRFPHVVNLPIVKASGGMTLERVMALGAGFVPQEQIQAAWRELKGL